MPQFPRAKWEEYSNSVAEKKVDQHFMIKAAIVDLEAGLPIRAVAEKHGVSRSALHRHYQKYSKLSDDEKANYSGAQKFGFATIFTPEEEASLSQYLLQASRMCYGLTSRDTRTLAYNYAVANNKTVPDSWIDSKEAGIDWLAGFRARNPELSLRKPEATSLGRATSFNKHNVQEFFSNLQSVLKKTPFTASDIFNCDETSVTTVHVPPKVFAEKGRKIVGKVTSAERGVLVTMVGTISASGQYLPPYLIFPRKKFQPLMLTGAPANSAGGASPSGWVNQELFLEYLKHFKTYSHASPESPKLLIMDNHESHICSAVVQFAKESGITLLTIPPHCSHRLQPLDICVYFPFKCQYNKAMDNWMLSNPGKTVTIYEIASLVGQSLPVSFTPNNIMRGFEKTGIWPYNPDIFTENDFLTSAVTDRPAPDALDPVEPGNNLAKTPSTSGPEQSSTPVSVPVTPEQVRPYPKAKPRVLSGRGRKKGSTKILTDTPVKRQIEEQEAKRKDKKARGGRARGKVGTVGRAGKAKKDQTTKKLFVDSEGSDDEKMILDDDSDDSMKLGESEDESEKEEEIFDSVSTGDFVKVVYKGEYFPGSVQEKNENSVRVSVMCMAGLRKWKWLDQEDSIFYPREDILKKLSPPTPAPGTASRAASYFVFADW